MFFGILKKKYKSLPLEETKAVGMRWADLLKTAGVNVQVFPIEPGQILFTEYEGVMMQIKDFILDQPEAASFKFKEQVRGSALPGEGRRLCHSCRSLQEWKKPRQSRRGRRRRQAGTPKKSWEDMLGDNVRAKLGKQRPDAEL